MHLVSVVFANEVSNFFSLTLETLLWRRGLETVDVRLYVVLVFHRRVDLKSERQTYNSTANEIPNFPKQDVPNARSIRAHLRCDW